MGRPQRRRRTRLRGRRSRTGWKPIPHGLFVKGPTRYALASQSGSVILRARAGPRTRFPGVQFPPRPVFNQPGSRSAWSAARGEENGGAALLLSRAPRFFFSSPCGSRARSPLAGAAARIRRYKTGTQRRRERGVTQSKNLSEILSAFLCDLRASAFLSENATWRATSRIRTNTRALALGARLPA